MPRQKTRIMWGSLLLTCLLTITLPMTIWGKDRVLRIENKCGLQVEVPEKAVDLGNLNPGQAKESRIKFTNKGTQDLTLFIRTNIENETTENGGYLSEVMELTMKEKGQIIAEDSFRGLAQEGNILLGTIEPGKNLVLDMSSYLPGYETGNKYQGAYMRVNWTFVTQCSSMEEREENGNEGEGGGASGGNTNIPPEEIILEEEELPLGVIDPPLEDELIIGDNPSPKGEPGTGDESPLIIEDEMMPYGTLEMPKTGQVASFYYFGIGSALMAMGLYFNKNKANK